MKIKDLLLKLYPIFKKEKYPKIVNVINMPDIEPFEVNFAGERLRVIKLEDHERILEYFTNLLHKKEE